MAGQRYTRAFRLPSGREACLEARLHRDGEVVFELTWSGPGSAQRMSPETIERFMSWRQQAERELRAELIQDASKLTDNELEALARVIDDTGVGCHSSYTAPQAAQLAHDRIRLRTPAAFGLSTQPAERDLLAAIVYRRRIARQDDRVRGVADAAIEKASGKPRPNPFVEAVEKFDELLKKGHT